MKSYDPDYHSDFEEYGDLILSEDYRDLTDADVMDVFNTRKQPLICFETMPIHKLIKLKRCHDELTLRELAEKLKISITVLRQVEQGKRPMPKNRFAELERWMFHELYMEGQLCDIIEQ